MIPLKVLYGISDIAFIIIYRIVGYRKNIVRKNLYTSFPDKSEKELRDIEKKFYHWFCDYIVETIKLLTITPDEIRRRMEWVGLDNLYASYDRGQGASVCLGHHGNWEWLSAIGVFYPENYHSVINGLIYHALNNNATDKVMLKIRSSLGGTCINKKDILRELITLRRDKKNYLMGYIFDQIPKYENMHLWIDFLNHDTPVFTGAERIIRKFDNTTFFLKTERPERGRYRVTFIPITEHPNEEPEFEITKKCMALLEKSINENPHLYLWTHNRWKRTHKDYEGWLERHGRK